MNGIFIGFRQVLSQVNDSFRLHEEFWRRQTQPSRYLPSLKKQAPHSVAAANAKVSSPVRLDHEGGDRYYGIGRAFTLNRHSLRLT